MDGDVLIKLIFATSLTVMYSVLFIVLRPDIASAITIITAFTNALTGVIVRNLTKRKSERGP